MNELASSNPPTQHTHETQWPMWNGNVVSVHSQRGCFSAGCVLCEIEIASPWIFVKQLRKSPPNAGCGQACRVVRSSDYRYDSYVPGVLQHNAIAFLQTCLSSDSATEKKQMKRMKTLETGGFPQGNQVMPLFSLLCERES